jgi:CheY-like chemotaxis protein
MIDLSSFEHKIYVFTDAELALSKLQKLVQTNSNEIPEVLFLDINMPVLDGWQFLDELSKDGPFPVIHIYLVSSSIDPIDHKKAEEYGVVKQLLVKPLSVKKLEQIKADLNK